MPLTIFSRGAALLLLASASSRASAHTGAHDAVGFSQGLAHPIGGLDHVLAMVMIGLLAWQLGGRARILVPGAFVTGLLFGGTIAAAGLAWPLVEQGILASVIVLGLALAMKVRGRLPAVMALAALFGTFHGYAHGAEMPGEANALAYGVGFVLGTVLLHACGLALGFVTGRHDRAHTPRFVRAAGSAVALVGIGLALGLGG